MLREMKPRKAAFGFTARLSVENLRTIADAIDLVRKYDPKARFETVISCGQGDFKLYTDEPLVANMVRVQYVRQA